MNPPRTIKSSKDFRFFSENVTDRRQLLNKRMCCVNSIEVKGTAIDPSKN